MWAIYVSLQYQNWIFVWNKVHINRIITVLTKEWIECFKRCHFCFVLLWSLSLLCNFFRSKGCGFFKESEVICFASCSRQRTMFKGRMHDRHPIGIKNDLLIIWREQIWRSEKKIQVKGSYVVEKAWNKVGAGGTSKFCMSTVIKNHQSSLPWHLLRCRTRAPVVIGRGELCPSSFAQRFLCHHLVPLDLFIFDNHFIWEIQTAKSWS